MYLTHTQRTALRAAVLAEQSRRRNATLRATTRAPKFTNRLERETSGPDPWSTRSAPGRSFDDALNTDPLVTRVR